MWVVDQYSRSETYCSEGTQALLSRTDQIVYCFYRVSCRDYSYVSFKISKVSKRSPMSVGVWLQLDTVSKCHYQSIQHYSR